MILYHALSGHDEFIEPKENGLISNFIIDEVLKRLYPDTDLSGHSDFGKILLTQCSMEKISDVVLYLQYLVDEVSEARYKKTKLHLSKNKAYEMLYYFIHSATDKNNSYFENWVSLSANPMDEKKIYDEQKICNVAVVNTEWERYRGKNYKNLVINEGNVTKYFNCVPGYKIVTLLNACEYERIIYGISGIYDILAPKGIILSRGDREKQNRKYIDELLSMYPVDSFERKLIEEHWEKNKSLKFITNCCSDIFPEKNVNFFCRSPLDSIFLLLLQ